MVKKSIVREATKTQEITNERLMSMTLNLAGKSNAITFVVAYGPTGTCPIRENKRMHFGRIWIVLLVKCPAANIGLF